jgi:hypothetical protein
VPSQALRISSLKCKAKRAWKTKKSSKENAFFQIAKHTFFFIFLHFDPSYFNFFFSNGAI